MALIGSDVERNNPAQNKNMHILFVIVGRRHQLAQIVSRAIVDTHAPRRRMMNAFDLPAARYHRFTFCREGKCIVDGRLLRYPSHHSLDSASVIGCRNLVHLDQLISN